MPDENEWLELCDLPPACRALQEELLDLEPNGLRHLSPEMIEKIAAHTKDCPFCEGMFLVSLLLAFDEGVRAALGDPRHRPTRRRPYS